MALHPTLFLSSPCCVWHLYSYEIFCIEIKNGLAVVALSLYIPMKYSVIVPVFNRPDEVDELLESLLTQSVKDFEVIVVEDGSTVSCQSVCEKYSDRLDLKYYRSEERRVGKECRSRWSPY